ncbi:MAG: adenine deaminase [Candidatus Syntropharchaeia archaeon]
MVEELNLSLSGSQESIRQKSDLIDCALGKRKADLVIKDIALVNVFSGEIYETDIAIFGERIAGLGKYSGKNEMDGRGKYAVPGLIDGHTHIEMSMLSPSEFARIVVPRGTTAVIEDPHEIANVLGRRGIELILKEAKTIPLKIFCMIPSCVPATELETSGARIDSKEISELLNIDGVIGLGEMMNFPGVLSKDEKVLKKLNSASKFPIDGHAPLLSGKELCAYVCAGIGSDHESTSFDEALEKLRLGMRVMIREGSTAKNLKNLIPLLEKENRNCILVTDGDRTPEDLIEEGYLDHVLRRAIEEGIDPITAIQMCTINPATYFRLHDLGSIAPGKIADMVILSDLEGFKVDRVIVDGRIVREIPKTFKYPEYAKNTIKLRSHLKKDDLRIEGKKRVIVIIEGEILTDEMGEVSEPDVGRDILKIAVIERHKRTGNIGLGFVHGFGIKRGAVASSIAHDSHNIIAIGVKDEDIVVSVNRLEEIGGGIVITEDGRISEELPLPIAGLMSDERAEDVTRKMKKLKKTLSEMGCRLKSPFISLSFLALPVIPKLKITDKGLVDVERFEVL